MQKSRQIEQKVFKFLLKEGYIPEQYAISPDDKYLAIGLKFVQFGNILNKIAEVQILDLECSNIIQLIKMPEKLINQIQLSSLILRFSKDSSYLYISDRDNIFYISTKRKQISKFKAHDSPISNIIELKYRILLYSTNNRFNIIRNNKIIKKMHFNTRLSSIDYNPLNELIMIQQQESILIISLQNLQILCTHPMQFLKNAFFLQNNIITLENHEIKQWVDRYDVKVWETNNKNQSIILEEKYFQSFLCSKFEKLFKLEINAQQNFIILFLFTKIFILDSKLQLVEQIRITAPNEYSERYQQSSKSKVYYFDSSRQLIYILPIIDQK